MPVAESGTGSRVESPQIFDKGSLDRLKDGAKITAISTDGENSVAHVAHAAKAPSTGLLSKAFTRLVSLARGEANLGKRLFSVYVRKFRNLTGKTVSPAQEASPHVSPSTLQKLSKPDDLSTPEGFRVASAMELAGVCKLTHGRFGGVRIKSSRKDLDEIALRRVDYFVNLNPHRLAFEFLALGRSVPNGYLERVLVPHYCDRLIQEAGYKPDDAHRAVSTLLSLQELSGDNCVDLEHLMEMRNALDHLVDSHTRDVRLTKPRDRHHPKGSQLTGGLPGSVKVTTSQVLEHGQVSRQVVRDYMIKELRRVGVPREQAREQVVAALAQRGFSEVSSQLSILRFLNVAQALKLDKHHSQPEMIKVYLGLVDHLNEAVRCVSPNQRKRILEKAGLEPSETCLTRKDTESKSLHIIERPLLEAPKVSAGYTCNEDELWLIQAKVDRSHTVRITKDIIKRALRYAARSKRVIGVEVAARLSAALTLGLMSGGIAGALYLVTSCVSASCLLIADFAWSHVQFWRHGRQVLKYDDSGNPSDDSMRNKFVDSMGYLAGEKALTDTFNAYANLKDDLEGLEKLQGRSRLSAADQIKFRQRQVLQHLRSAQLGESFKDVDRYVVETMTDISRLESEFESDFDDLWKPFDLHSTGSADESGDTSITSEVSEDGFDSDDDESIGATQPFKRMTDERRAKIFRKAARKLKELPLKAKEDSQSWLRELALRGDTTPQHEGEDASKVWRKGSDKTLHDVFSQLKPLPPKELRRAAFTARLKWTSCNSLGAAMHTAKVIAHLVVASITSNIGTAAKMAFRFLVQDILPRKIDLTPIPTTVACVYWVVSFIGSRTMEAMNNMLNRLKVRKVIQSRKNEKGEDLAFDAEVTNLTTADWRAMRRESQHGIKDFSKTLKALRKEHALLAEEIKKTRSADENKSKRKELTEKELVHRALLILRRKYLENKLQDILAGSVGHFFQETIRGELAHRQLLEDEENDIVPVHA